ncbi:hypothetical protein BO71DRAFT_432665 [Aspergillus ellipticus CBS 707.79]|uniref:Uncharacterized protein n=1 Tax=Aspergillus ellipticus CBS 707.79 TaxID=1448320 RepID=A0A319DU55_9EURO|nr:hypothetical protein BO71DRAFT_432665 [Aspergillus ellipticus CBS 707.79]
MSFDMSTVVLGIIFPIVYPIAVVLSVLDRLYAWYSTRAPAPSWHTLPQDVVVGILMECPNLPTLQAVINSHPQVDQAFRSAEAEILAGVMSRTIHPDYWDLAFLAYDASMLEDGQWTRARVHQILNHHLQAHHDNWTLRKAMACAELHRHVLHFTKDYLQQALTVLLSPFGEPTADEELRVGLAFYRFEIHRHLFRPRQNLRVRREAWSPQQQPLPQVPAPLLLDFTSPEMFQFYYSQFAVWEVEQVVALTEYLFRITAPLVRQLVDEPTLQPHRVEIETEEAWEGLRNARTANVLSYGLAFLHTLLETADPRVRRDMLLPKLDERLFWLPYILKNVYQPPIDPTRSVPELMEQDDDALDGNSPDSDGDGPATVWRAAHNRSHLSQFIGNDNYRGRRQQGYVFWNQSRYLYRRWSLFLIARRPPLPLARIQTRVPQVVERRRWPGLAWDGASWDPRRIAVAGLEQILDWVDIAAEYARPH